MKVIEGKFFPAEHRKQARQMTVINSYVCVCASIAKDRGGKARNVLEMNRSLRCFDFLQKSRVGPQTGRCKVELQTNITFTHSEQTQSIDL